jgi:branched-chain amino acid transport system substrate-binding protein
MIQVSTRARHPARRHGGWRAIAAALLACSTAAAAQAGNCVTGSTVHVSQSIDLTGPQHWVGLEFTQGAQLYLRRVNASGGVNGRTVKLDLTDDKFDAKLTAANVAAAIGSTCAVFGTMGTGQTLAAVQAAGGVPVIAPLTGTAGVRAPTEGKAFFVRGTYSDEVRAMVRHAAAVGLTRFALVAPADAFGHPIVPVYQEAVRKEGGTSVALLSVPSVNTTAFAATVAALREAHPDVVIAYLSQTFPEFITAYRGAHVGAQVYTISLAYGSKLAELPPEYLRGIGITQTTPSPWDQTRPVIREFADAQKKDGGKVPVSFAAVEGYIGAKLLVEALKRAGKDPTPESVRQVLHDMPAVDIGGFLVPNRGEGRSYIEIGVLDRQGRYRD